MGKRAYAERVRPSRDALREKGITKEELAKKYEELGSLRALSQWSGISFPTVQKYIKSMGISKEPGSGDHRHYGAVANWLWENPKVTLPRSYKKMSEIMGLDVKTVRDYWKRRRKAVRDELNDLPEFWTLDKVGNLGGRAFMPHLAKSYEIEIDKYDMSLLINVKYKTGMETTYRTTLEGLKEFISGEEKDD